MSDVPAEILREILSRLPVAPLLRFRSVSKQWKCLIDSVDFLKHNLHRSRKSNSHHNIIMRKYNLYSIDFDLLNETNRATFQLLSHPLKTPSFATEVLGSCDGLLALVNGEEEEEELQEEKGSIFWNPFAKCHKFPFSADGRVENHDKDIVLWNPSARRFHKLPVSGIEHSDPQYFSCTQLLVYGFGYDFVTDDYKLVRIVQFYGQSECKDEFNSEVKVYSLKSDSWRRIPDFPYYLKYKRWHGKFVNGALHWIVCRNAESDTDSLIAAFDLGTEECRLVPLPEYVGDKVHKDHMNVVALGGCLGIVCYKFTKHTEVWVMKEYGVQESWSFLFTLSQPDVFPQKFECMLPIAYSKCGSKVLVALGGRLLMWYDLEKNSVDQLEVQFPSENCFDFYPCLQSLVLLNSGTRDFNIVDKKSQETMSEKKGSGKRDDFLSKGFKLVL